LCTCRTSPEELVARLESFELERQKKKELEAKRECSATASASRKLQTDTLLQAKPKVRLFKLIKVKTNFYVAYFSLWLM